MTRLRAKKANVNRWAKHRYTAAAHVRQRWERNGHKCEGCGHVVDVVEVAHLFGRRNLIREPYASDPTLLAALCCASSYADRIGCHEKIDRNIDEDLRDRLRSDAIILFCRRLNRPVPATTYADPVAAIHEIERWLEESEEAV